MMNQVIELPTPARKRAESQSLMQQAWAEQDTEKSLQLAQQALDHDPNCIDALSVLISHGRLSASIDPIQALEAALVLEAEELQQMALDVEFSGNYWSNSRTRVYVRAMAVLVRLYLHAQKWSAAKQTCREIMELDRRDTQGQRYILAKLLIRDAEYADFHNLDAQFKNENSVMFLFNRALVAYIEQGRCDDSDALAKRALVFNPKVVRYFEKTPETVLPTPNGLSPEVMAWLYVKENRALWTRTPGAIRWLSGVFVQMRSA